MCKAILRHYPFWVGGDLDSTAPGSIHTVEARCKTYILENAKGNPVISNFAPPLDTDEVYYIASAFIVGFPSTNPNFPVEGSLPQAKG